MKLCLIYLVAILSVNIALGQVKDSAYYQRVDERVSVSVDYFEKYVTDDPATLDTVAYVKRIYAFHIEKIRAVTDDPGNRRRMYDYAVKLHNKRMADVLNKDIIQIYRDSFFKDNPGFSFCPVCQFKEGFGRLHCGHCGEALTDPKTNRAIQDNR